MGVGGGRGVLQEEGLLQELTIVMEGLVVAVFWAPAAFFLAGLNSWRVHGQAEGSLLCPEHMHLIPKCTHHHLLAQPQQVC